MMLLLPKWLAGFSGVFVDNFGYSSFFISTAIIGVPVLILIWLTIRFKVVEFKKHDSQMTK
jgi:PAT family beta-lactamase induction signal transducer AmpG